MVSNKLIKIFLIPFGIILYLYGFYMDTNIGSVIMSIGGLLVFIPLLNYCRKNLEKRLFKFLYIFTILIISIIFIFLVITIKLLI